MCSQPQSFTPLPPRCEGVMLLWLPGLTCCCPALHSFGEALSAWVGKALLSSAERKKDSLLASDVAEQSPWDCSHHLGASSGGSSPGSCGCQQGEAGQKHRAVLDRLLPLCLCLTAVGKGHTSLCCWTGMSGGGCRFGIPGLCSSPKPLSILR